MLFIANKNKATGLLVELGKGNYNVKDTTPFIEMLLLLETVQGPVA